MPEEKAKETLPTSITLDFDNHWLIVSIDDDSCSGMKISLSSKKLCWERKKTRFSSFKKMESEKIMNFF